MNRDRSFVLTNVLGYTLKKGIVIVAVTSIIISAVTLLTSIIYLSLMSSKETYNSDPVKAINFMTALLGTSTSLYQIIITFILLWFIRSKNTTYMLTLWFTTNVWFLVLFFFLFLARTAVCLNAKLYLFAFLNAKFLIIYEVLFIYFCAIVSSYKGSLHPEAMYF